MSDYRWLTFEGLDEGVRVLSLDRPPVNALGRGLVDELLRAFEALGSDEEARCLVVRSAGKHFCAGADLKERREMSLDEVREFVPRLALVCSALADLPFPTIAAVRGAAAGGGCELALACDLRIVSEDARMGLRETALAIIPGAGGTQRLPRLVGVARAKRWIFTASMHSAQQALADGAADRVTSPERLDEEARELASIIAANGPVAVRLAKRAIREGLDRSLVQGLRVEWDCYRETLETEDRVEALRAFADKRAPRFRGR